MSVAEQSGIHFTLGQGHRSPLTILETAGGGCAFLDYDNDGWPDILLVGPYHVALYHNRGVRSQVSGDGKNQHPTPNTQHPTPIFEDVTAQSGLDPKRHWMGCAVGDYDGDGLPDIFLTGYHCFALYRNLGGGKFQDVTAQSGISGLDWSLSAAFADFNGDGKLDLYVSQYLHFDAKTPQICEVGRTRSACGPEIYQPLSGKLFLNTDGRHFKAVPNWKDTGKTWGALASDLMDTGSPALYLANDMMPGDLWERQGGKWRNVGDASSTAFDGQGHLQGGMGVDSGDYDNDGRLDLVVTTYFAQGISLYHNDGNGLFSVKSGPTGIGPPTMPYVKFGTLFTDLDNDGWLDLILTSGHVRDNVHDFDASETYAQPIQVFRNEKGRFTDVSAAAGIANERLVGRGLAVADYNRDGKPDVLICNLNGPALLLENRSTTGHWLDARLQASGPNRDGLGARLTLKAGTQTQIREIRTSGSVLSALYPVAHFGLGAYAGPAELQVRWPDGKTQKVNVQAVDTFLTVKKP